MVPIKPHDFDSLLVSAPSVIIYPLPSSHIRHKSLLLPPPPPDSNSSVLLYFVSEDLFNRIALWGYQRIKEGNLINHGVWGTFLLHTHHVGYVYVFYDE